MRIAIRRMEPQDQPFIFSSWLKSYKKNSDFAKHIPDGPYYKNHHALIEHLLKKPSCIVLVAHAGDDLDRILGYLVFEDTDSGHLIHYVFVKEAFQGSGIAKALIKYAGIDPHLMGYSHLTYDIKTLREYGKVSLSYDPYRI